MDLESDQSEESIRPRHSGGSRRPSRGSRRESETEHELREKLLKQVQEKRRTKILAKPEAFNVGAVPVLPVSPQIPGVSDRGRQSAIPDPGFCVNESQIPDPRFCVNESQILDPRFCVNESQIPDLRFSKPIPNPNPRFQTFKTNPKCQIADF